MIRAPMLGSHAPADVSQCVLLPLPTVFTHMRAFFIMNVPVRKRVPCPVTSACALALLVIVALPSMKTVPWTLSVGWPVTGSGFGFHESWPALDLHEYEVAGVRLMAELPAGVALLLRS